jgi:hypothetical protein
VYLLPKHPLVPELNAMKYLVIDGSSIHRSGLNTSASSPKAARSRCMVHVGTETSV